MTKKIGALWKKTTQDGKTYLSGVLSDLRGDINIAVFKNDRKEKDNQPDYNIVLSQQQEKKERPAGDGDFGFGEAQPEPSAPAGEEDINVDNIPF